MRYSLYNLIIVSLLLFTRCTNQEPTFNDLVGTWISKDGSKIILENDSICEVKDLDMKKIFLNQTEYLSFKGKWTIRETDDVGQKIYNIYIKEQSNGLNIQFYISGEGLLGNSPPWHLFQYIGDPDDLNKYKFMKEK